MTLRIRVEELGDEVRKCLERGESVEIERDGVVVARVEPEPGPEGKWLELIRALRSGPPLDEDFGPDLEQIRREMNTPIGPSPWES